MQLRNVAVIAKREYLQRAKTKAFWITTLILPLFVTGISTLPALLLSKSKANQKIVGQASVLETRSSCSNYRTVSALSEFGLDLRVERRQRGRRSEPSR